MCGMHIAKGDSIGSMICLQSSIKYFPIDAVRNNNPPLALIGPTWFPRFPSQLGTQGMILCLSGLLVAT